MAHHTAAGLVRAKEREKLVTEGGLHLSLAEHDASSVPGRIALVRRSQRPVHRITKRFIAKGVRDLERQTFEVGIPHHAIRSAHRHAPRAVNHLLRRRQRRDRKGCVACRSAFS